ERNVRLAVGNPDLARCKIAAGIAAIEHDHARRHRFRVEQLAPNVGDITVFDLKQRRPHRLAPFFESLRRSPGGTRSPRPPLRGGAPRFFELPFLLGSRGPRSLQKSPRTVAPACPPVWRRLRSSPTKTVASRFCRCRSCRGCGKP